MHQYKNEEEELQASHMIRSEMCQSESHFISFPLTSVLSIFLVCLGVGDGAGSSRLLVGSSQKASGSHPHLDAV